MGFRMPPPAEFSAFSGIGTVGQDRDGNRIELQADACSAEVGEGVRSGKLAFVSGEHVFMSWVLDIRAKKDKSALPDTM